MFTDDAWWYPVSETCQRSGLQLEDLEYFIGGGGVEMLKEASRRADGLSAFLYAFGGIVIMSQNHRGDNQKCVLPLELIEQAYPLFLHHILSEDLEFKEGRVYEADYLQQFMAIMFLYPEFRPPRHQTTSNGAPMKSEEELLNEDLDKIYEKLVEHLFLERDEGADYNGNLRCLARVEQCSRECSPSSSSSHNLVDGDGQRFDSHIARRILHDGLPKRILEHLRGRDPSNCRGILDGIAALVVRSPIIAEEFRQLGIIEDLELIHIDNVKDTWDGMYPYTAQLWHIHEILCYFAKMGWGDGEALVKQILGREWEDDWPDEYERLNIPTILENLEKTIV